jgi:hypothetical protein
MNNQTLLVVIAAITLLWLLLKNHCNNPSPCKPVIDTFNIGAPGVTFMGAVHEGAVPINEVAKIFKNDMVELIPGAGKDVGAGGELIRLREDGVVGKTWNEILNDEVGYYDEYEGVLYTNDRPDPVARIRKLGQAGRDGMFRGDDIVLTPEDKRDTGVKYSMNVLANSAIS